ncbi:hypothetical protein WKH56_20230 [Priestia sp. SB1]|uniref:hypothetical protein n=1 Tax=Priestia sp. SB1 TaxID=3132359 RepID=UPI003173DC25
MAKAYKVEIYIVDSEEDIQDLDQLKTELKKFGSRLWVDLQIAKIAESDKFEWDENLRINQRDADIEDYKAYFKE